MSAVRCPTIVFGARRACGTVLDFVTDGNGRVLAHCPVCARKPVGRCRECHRAVHGRAVICGVCRLRKQRQRDAHRNDDPDRAARRRYCDRLRWAAVAADPVQRAARRERRRAWRAENPDKVRLYKRRYALGQSDGYKRSYTRANADPERREQKRQYSLKRYYDEHPDRPDPRCRVCTRRIAWSPPGRPPTRCDECVPRKVRKLRKVPRPPLCDEPTNRGTECPAT